jgi:hypothetical protein
MESKRRLSAHEVREVAVISITDPRTVVKYLRGERVQSTSALRIERALADLELVDHPERRAAR